MAARCRPLQISVIEHPSCLGAWTLSLPTAHGGLLGGLPGSRRRRAWFRARRKDNPRCILDAAGRSLCRVRPREGEYAHVPYSKRSPCFTACAGGGGAASSGGRSAARHRNFRSRFSKSFFDRSGSPLLPMAQLVYAVCGRPRNCSMVRMTSRRFKG